MEWNKNQLRVAREAKGWTSSELSARLTMGGWGVTYQSIRNWETGKYKPGVDNLRGLADLLGVSVEFFFLPDKKGEVKDDNQAVLSFDGAKSPAAAVGAGS